MAPPKGYRPPNTGTGSGWIDSNGYRCVYVHKSGKRLMRREHRVIVEAHLGRDLLRSEDVHHINGDKTDNRIENLEVGE
jgi:hypothetical protein